MYVERDLSWMYFNRRILQEASREEMPLLERFCYLGIYSNNLDEFFRVRMATLNRIAECTDRSLRREKLMARDLIVKINALNAQYAQEFQDEVNTVTARLRDENIFIIKEDELDDEQKSFVTNYYREKLSGFIGAIWLTPFKELDEEDDDNIYLAVKMKDADDCADYAIIVLPVKECGRFVRLPDKNGAKYLMYLDDVVRFCLPMVFGGLDYRHFEAYAFKFTKDAEMEFDNDLQHGTLQKIAKGVKSRQQGDALRVIYDSAMPADMVKRIKAKFDLDELDTIINGGRYNNHKDMMSFPTCERTDLKYPTWSPISKPELDHGQSLLELIQASDRFIHVPYHNFDYYIRVLQEAAVSKHVKSISTTLYRLAKDSKVVKALICAARNGKKVKVVIELLARFDEESNIDWSKKMQDAGIHVIFGVEGLKVHSKITHIEMKRGRDIACISTGNFHEGNARMYTDFMLMTASPSIVVDVQNVFNFIQKPYLQVRFKELLVSPNEMRNKFVRLINEEIKNKNAGKEAWIKIKINHITDVQMVRKLYDASARGVKIDLLVRGNCSLITGVEGVSENIRARGIIDRFLEHSRIYIFCAGGEEKTFIGSADWMPRNLSNRIEVVAPVYDAQIKKELQRIVDYGLMDNQQARVVDGTGRNTPIVPAEGEVQFRSQEELYRHYKANNI